MPHEHEHGSHPYDHAPRPGILGWVAQMFHLGGHEHASLAADSAFSETREGIRAVWLALLALGVTSALQIGIVAFSGSVALLADTVHNIGDTLNSIPLLIAFYLARRLATRRYTYGFGRAEDVAGIFIVLSIAVSAGVVFWESFQKLLDPQPMQNTPWVAAAAVIGFLGNEAVALLQIRVGRKIGSDAMIADGLHARIDGITSLAVLVAAGGTLIGLPILDPIIGLLIGVAILFITRDAATRIWYRLMDAVDPSLVTQIEHYTTEVSGVQAVKRLRVRWVGHRLLAEMNVAVEETLSLAESHQIARSVEQALRRVIPHLSEITIQTAPQYAYETDPIEQKIAGMNILPPRYQLITPSAAPMGAAGLKFDSDGNAAWDEIWTDFCDLALAGGPPHRGTLLEPVAPEVVLGDPDGYRRVLDELKRGIHMVTGLEVIQSGAPGWIGMVCTSEDMAVWLLRAIVVENISVRREGSTLYFPASPTFRLESEIKNVITVIAKTYHYWQEHVREVS
ncbi:cation diffusion facilitator family transporter [Kamptonema cortianum]|nr:cation diffusion facilitator family transporter [Oscillatoria laete-virens]MDK3159340.1 cation diffusion facilitator family transporter [Kamptonema cortianum]MDL5054979.1 cation diffusion facilitator family transporter [Oscillatoria laete-virens NRMC-F 0139]